MARKKLSPQEKKARQDMLKSETIEQRTTRVLNPRINKLRKQIIVLTKAFNSPRYKLNNEQQEKLTEELSENFDMLVDAIQKTKDIENLEDIL